MFREEEEPDSTESSVEGIYVSGVRSLHPFKVSSPQEEIEGRFPQIGKDDLNTYYFSNPLFE